MLESLKLRFRCVQDNIEIKWIKIDKENEIRFRCVQNDIKIKWWSCCNIISAKFFNEIEQNLK